jgi:MFS family permease
VTPAATVSGPTATDERGPAIARRYLVYLAGRTVSLVGDGVWLIALAWAAAAAGGPSTTSLVLASGTVPRAALMLFGGAVVDRFGARWVMLRSDTARIALMAAAAVVAASAEPGVPVLVALAVTFGLVDALYDPAAGTVPPQLLRPDALPRGQALAQLCSRGADMVGAPLGAALVAGGGLALACAVDAVTFGAVLAAVLAVRLPSVVRASQAAGARTSLWRDVRAGLHYTAGHEVVRPLLLLVAALNGLGGPVTGLGVLLRVRAEGWGIGGLAAFEVAFSAAAVAGALGVARKGSVRRPGVTGTWWAVLQAVGIAAVGLAPTLSALVAAGAVVGLTAGPASAYLLGQIQTMVERHYLGRVMSLVSFSAVGLAPVSFALFGALAEVVPVPALAAGCGALMLPPCVLALRTRALRAPTLPDRRRKVRL